MRVFVAFELKFALVNQSTNVYHALSLFLVHFSFVDNIPL